MRKIIRSLSVGIIVLLACSVNAQQTVPVQVFDKVALEADSYRGSIQWEFSGDGLEWNDIPEGNISPFEVTINQFPSYFRARINEEGCTLPHYSEEIEVINSIEVKYWSEIATWSTVGKPIEGDEVVIPEGEYIILDETPPDLGGLTINGVLEFDRKDLELTSEWIMVNGMLRVGYEHTPFEQQAIITLNDTDTEASIMDMGTRGIMVMGSLELHGTIPEVLWTKLDEHAPVGSTTLSLIDESDWKVGDQIVIAPTDYYEAGFGASITQRVEVEGIDGNQLMISEGLNAHRWGLLQYATADGMSTDPSNAVSPPVADTETESTPLVLDQRAEVANMTRNIVVQAPDDTRWNEGFGVHTMIMPSGTAHVEGVEFRRAGQRARLRRYAFHWHMLSYSGSETLADAEGQYFRNNTVNSSANRGVVIHGTNGVLVQNNIIYDVRGHGFFLEDAVERRNVIDGNLIFHVRNPEWGSQLLEHEQGEFGSSGFWLSNPDNIVTNNIAADCQTFGFWLAYPVHPWGLNQEVLHTDGLILRPNRLLFGIFDNNTSHSQKNDGIHLDRPQMDEAGNTFPAQYWSTVDGRADGSQGFDALRRFSLSRYKTWKNQDNGAWDRGALTDIFEVVSADNCGRFFAGSGSEGVIERSLVVGTSLNWMMNGTGRPAIADFQFNPSSAPTAFATYHSAFSMRNNIVVNFPVVEHDRAGAFASDDYYEKAVDRGQIRNYDNLLIQTHPGVKLKPMYGYLTFTSALWDPYGLWGPEENYFVYDDPFLTYGKEITTVDLGTEIVGGVSVAGPFYGFRGFVLHGVGWEAPLAQPYNDYMEIHVSRFDAADLSSEVASWSVEEANPDWILAHMRDFATTRDGIYELTFPSEDIDPTDFQMNVENMLDEDDFQVIGVQFDGNIIDPLVQLLRQYEDSGTSYSKVESLQAVIGSSGETYWQDVANNRIWVKLQGGRWTERGGDDFELVTHEIMVLQIRAN